MKRSFKDVISSEIPVLVDFYADWCGPCKMLAPILKEVKDELGDTIRVIKIDVDKNQSLAAKYQVRGVPTLLLFKKGKQLWRQSGVVPKKDLVQLLQLHQQS
jgi:thioredoxin 1